MQDSNQGAADASVDQVAQHSVAVQAGTEHEASTQVALDPSYQGIGMPANKQANVRGNQAQGAANSKSEAGANAAAGSFDNASASEDVSQRAARAAGFPWLGSLPGHVVAAVESSQVSNRQLLRMVHWWDKELQCEEDIEKRQYLRALMAAKKRDNLELTDFKLQLASCLGFSRWQYFVTLVDPEGIDKELRAQFQRMQHLKQFMPRAQRAMRESSAVEDRAAMILTFTPDSELPSRQAVCMRLAQFGSLEVYDVGMLVNGDSKSIVVKLTAQGLMNASRGMAGGVDEILGMPKGSVLCAVCDSSAWAILQKAGLKVPAGAVNVQEIFMATRNMCITEMEVALSGREPALQIFSNARNGIQGAERLTIDLISGLVGKERVRRFYSLRTVEAISEELQSQHARAVQQLRRCAGDVKGNFTVGPAVLQRLSQEHAQIRRVVLSHRVCKQPLIKKLLAAWHELVRSKKAQKVADALVAEETREQEKQKRQQQRQAARKGQQPRAARRDARTATGPATVAEPMQGASAEAATPPGQAASTGAKEAATTTGSAPDRDGQPASPAWHIAAGREGAASRLACELAAAQNLHFALRASQNAALGKLATAQRLLLPAEPNRSQAAGMLGSELAAAQSRHLPPRASQSPARGQPADAAAAKAMGSPADGSAKHRAVENNASPAKALEAFFPPEQATVASAMGQHEQGSHGGGDTGASKAPSAQTADPQELSRGGPEWQPGSKAERKRNKKKAVQAARAGLATCQGSATAQGSSGGRAAAAAAQDVGDPEAGADGLTGGFWAGWQPASAALPISHMRPTGSTAEPTAADSEDLEGTPQGSWQARREKDDGNTGLWTSGRVKASGSASESSKPAAPRLLMEDRECVMCLSEPPMTWLAPCGHQALCLGCTEQLFGRAGQPHVAGLCPVCRLPVLSYIAALFTT